MPLVGWLETPLKVPGSITEAVLGRQPSAKLAPTKADGGSHETTGAHVARLRRWHSSGRWLSPAPRQPGPPKKAAAEHAIERQDWSFGGFTGQFDKAQLQRGFQVYQQVCTACHGLKRVRFRNLAEPGGPEFPEASVKALAVHGRTRSRVNSTTRAIQSTGYPASPIPSSAPTRTTSRRARRRTARCRPTSRSSPRRAPSRATLPGTASGSTCCATWPPAIRRAGPDYLYALLTGYHEPPAGMQMTEGMNYNVAFPGHQLAMPPPLGEGQRRRVPAGIGLQRLARAERARRHGLPCLGVRSDPQQSQATRLAGSAVSVSSPPSCSISSRSRSGRV